MQMGVHVCKIQAHVGQERRNGSSVCEWLEHVQCHDVCYSNLWTAAKRSCAVPVCQSIISRKTPSATHALAVPRGTCPSAVPFMRSQPIKSCRLAPGPSATLNSSLGSDRGWADLCIAIARPVLVLTQLFVGHGSVALAAVNNRPRDSCGLSLVDSLFLVTL